MQELPSTSLERQALSILKDNREDSFGTQKKRGYHLCAVARMLHEKFGLQKWENLKLKHVTHVIEEWKAEDTGRRSIDEKLSHFRWLVRKIGKANLIPKQNSALGIEPGPRCTRAGLIVTEPELINVLQGIADDRIRMVILLARHLGLRFEEASLFRPGRDWDGDRVWVKRGTKGGRSRCLWLHSPSQRLVLERARASVSGDAGMIPKEFRTYEKWRQYVYHKIQRAGMARKYDLTFHDLRRTYAVRRMRNEVDVKKRTREDAAALVAREIGHSRVEILEWYLSDDELGLTA